MAEIDRMIKQSDTNLLPKVDLKMSELENQKNNLIH